MQKEACDAVLAAGLREGNDAAALRLIDTYSSPLYRYLQGRCARAEDAADILAMTFQKAVASIHTYDASRGSLLNWLYRIAFTCRADFYRHWGVQPLAALPEDDYLGGDDTARYSPEPWEYLVDEDLAEGDSRLTLAVQEVFAEMNPRYVEVLKLANTDLPREEIARIMDIKRDTLRVLINRATNQFRSRAERHPVLQEWLARAEPIVDEVDGADASALVMTGS